MDLTHTLEFLEDLAKHNHKEWMDDNKKRYLEAKEQVVELVAEVIHQSADFAPGISELEPKKTLFRINRDIRFSKNKDPYKTNFGAAIVAGGRKTGNPGFYLHIKPGSHFAGGGIYQPSPQALQKVRQEIDYNGKDAIGIITDATFKKTFGEPYGDDKLKTAPKGYPKDHEFVELLQLKHYVFMHAMTDQEICSINASKKIVEVYRTLQPFNDFLLRALD